MVRRPKLMVDLESSDEVLCTGRRLRLCPNPTGYLRSTQTSWLAPTGCWIMVFIQASLTTNDRKRGGAQRQKMLSSGVLDKSRRMICDLLAMSVGGDRFSVDESESLKGATLPFGPPGYAALMVGCDLAWRRCQYLRLGFRLLGLAIRYACILPA